ncbi:MAG: DoxX family membrane protein [Hyalangium sp.]|uniref:DoxX family membrane protein n=1 Tax=Hyalangium sp. TaxID=2028555 RepID=UPI00389AE10C
MNTAITLARVIMGLCFVIIGLNFWAKWFQLNMQGAAKRFLDAMEQSGYMHAVKTVEVSGGVMMLVGYNLPLALLLLGPVIANIFLFHACLDRKGLPLATLLVVLEGFLLFVYRAAFMGIFRGIES